MAKKCPCKECVPPKRYPGCAAKCTDWAEWSEAEEQRKAKIREAHNIEELCFPSQLRKLKKRRKK